MKLIKQITELNKAINKENNLGFIPTMGSIHKGHEFLIKESLRLCNKTLVSIFINPTQFNNKADYKSYPRNLKQDLKVLKKLDVNYVFLPTVNEIYKQKRLSKITLNKSQKIMCAKFRKGHFEGVLDVLDRFIEKISPKIMFMGEKDYQQFFLVKNFISKRYSTKVRLCKTIRNFNGMALSSRNMLLDKTAVKTAGKIANNLFKLKHKLYKIRNVNNTEYKKIIQKEKKKLIEMYNVKIEYLECRNLINLSEHFKNKKFKLFISYYLNEVRLIDNI